MRMGKGKKNGREEDLGCTLGVRQVSPPRGGLQLRANSQKAGEQPRRGREAAHLCKNVLFEPQHGMQVEMVGGLVQKQDVWRCE